MHANHLAAGVFALAQKLELSVRHLHGGARLAPGARAALGAQARAVVAIQTGAAEANFKVKALRRASLAMDSMQARRNIR